MKCSIKITHAARKTIAIYADLIIFRALLAPTHTN